MTRRCATLLVVITWGSMVGALCAQETPGESPAPPGTTLGEPQETSSATGGSGDEGVREEAAVKIFHLMNAVASDLQSMLVALYPDAQIVADARTNSLVVRGTREPLEEIAALILNFDETPDAQARPADSGGSNPTTARPRQRASDSTDRGRRDELESVYRRQERRVAELAKQLQRAQEALGSSKNLDPPSDSPLRSEVKAAFDVRQQWQMEEIRELRRRIDRLERMVEGRERNRERIIEGRVEELLRSGSKRTRIQSGGGGSTTEPGDPASVGHSSGFGASADLSTERPTGGVDEELRKRLAQKLVETEVELELERANLMAIQEEYEQFDAKAMITEKEVEQLIDADPKIQALQERLGLEESMVKTLSPDSPKYDERMKRAEKVRQELLDHRDSLHSMKAEVAQEQEIAAQRAKVRGAEMRVRTLERLVQALRTRLQNFLSPPPSGGARSSRTSIDPAAEVETLNARMNVREGDSPQFLRSSHRNNVSDLELPLTANVSSGKNILWSAKLGSLTHGSPVVANGKIYIGTNNGAGYVPRLPAQTDLSCLVCIDAQTGRFLWQHANEKLAAGRAQDWEQIGVCATPYVEGKRLWYVNNRNEVCCLDTEGFRDGKNDGPFQKEPNAHEDEADVIWKLDLIGRFGALPHNAVSCSVTVLGDTLFVGTSNGVGESHRGADPAAPNFVALDKNTGAVLWWDRIPGSNILHGQWSSPAAGRLGGVDQVIFAGGDGWIYSFSPQGTGATGEEAELLWKFDCNPKTSIYKLEGATRCPIIAAPVIYDGLAYVGVGDDPEHGEGIGRLWCIDPTKRGDVSPTIVYNKAHPLAPIPHQRLQACDPQRGDFERMNPNSALVWQYEGSAPVRFDEAMHRTLSSTAISRNLLFVSDLSGLVHCLDAKTGRAHWTHDLLASSWSTPLIAGNRVYIADLDGDVCVFQLSSQKNLLSEFNVGAPVYGTPTVGNGVLHLATSTNLYAIQEGGARTPDSDGSVGGE
ncbi:MAG: PQQ-binding-like beta-propeller repeat protein [Planctomycetales bacterium]